MATDTFTITGDVNVAVTLTENADGTVTFHLAVLDDTGSIGDLNAMYFDLYDDRLTSSLNVTGDDVTGSAFKVDGVTKIDNFTNMNGEVVKDLGKFDGGIQFGTQGISQDDIRETSFTLSVDGGALTLADFSLQDFGVRLTSVGEDGGAREDSLKLGATAPEFETAPEIDADDVVCVTEDKLFFGEPEADSFILLENDPGATEIVSVTNSNGETFDINAVDTIVTNGDGTQLMISPDGTFNVSVRSPFADPYGDLNDGDSAETSYTYTTDNGITATLTICIDGVTDGDSGGPVFSF